MKNTHDFPVELVPIYTYEAEPKAVGEPRYAEAPKRFAVQRTDNRAVLGVVSDKYKILRHELVVDGFREALKDGQRFEECIKVTKGGAHMFATYSFPDLTIRVRGGDDIALQFTVKNSYDGGNSLSIVLGAFRLVCSNGMIIGKKFLGFRWKHVGEAEVDVEAIRAKVQTLSASFQDSLPMMQLMASTQVSGEIGEKELFDGKTVPFPAYLLKAAAEEWRRAGDPTYWGYYNSLTWAITHRMKRESPQTAINHGRMAWELARRGAEAAK